MKRLSILLLALFPLAVQADEAAIRQSLSQHYPKATIKSVTPSPIPGIFEVYMGGQLVYSDASGDHLLIGPLVDTRTRTNLTQQRLEALTTVKFDSLPLDKAIVIVKGKGERKIAVFSDPECPYCKRLESELAKIDNLTVYVFELPLVDLHPHSLEIAKDIWCSADRAKSWDDYLLEGKKPQAAQPAGKPLAVDQPAEKPCETPLAAIASLAADLGISGTPAIVLSNGRRIDGSIPAAKLEEMLKGS